MEDKGLIVNAMNITDAGHIAILGDWTAPFITGQVHHYCGSDVLVVCVGSRDCLECVIEVEIDSEEDTFSKRRI